MRICLFKGGGRHIWGRGACFKASKFALSSLYSFVIRWTEKFHRSIPFWVAVFAFVVATMTPEEKKERNRAAVKRHRLHESAEARMERLRKQREYKQQRRLRKTGVHPESVTDIHIRPPMIPIQASTKRAALSRLQQALGADKLDECVCAVCDRFVLSRECHRIEVSDNAFMKRMKEQLDCESESLTEELNKQYDCSGISPSLYGILLSPRGITAESEKSIPRVAVCEECDDSLSKNQVPKFSIKNGFFVGVLPKRFADTSKVERFMIQPVTTVAVTRVMRGGAHRAIRSHCLAFDASPGPPATVLPRRLDGITSYRVVLAGPFTDEQQAKLKKMHRVRRQRVEDLLAFFHMVKNDYFSDIPVDCSELEAESSADQVYLEVIQDESHEEIGRDHDRVTDSLDEAFHEEDDVIERRMVFSEEAGEIQASEFRSVQEISDNTTNEPKFLVRHSSQFAQDDGDTFAKMFPLLFPYGRGHPGEARKIDVSLLGCVQYYLSLSSRAFAEDELFTLVAFDRIAMKNMYLNVSLRCKRYPEVFDGYSDISVDDLVEALRENDQRRKGRLSNADTNLTASRFLRSVEFSETSMWGSDAEREQCRRRAFGYQARFGQPALFVTLTPNVSGSFVLAHYAGITNVDTLFDAYLANPPKSGELRSAAFKNDFVSARIFMRNMDAFIEHVLGVHQSTNYKIFDGLFGDVDAYFGMVETQGSGTLHAHFLVWLSAAPPNSPAYKTALEERGDSFLSDIAQFTDSIVTTDFPIDVSSGVCRFCGESYINLKPLDIPSRSRMQRASEEVEYREPALLECQKCRMKVSSQHVLRQLLLRNRPPVWPPLMRELSGDELQERVVSEANAKDGLAQARTSIYNRELFLYETEEEQSSYGDFLESVNDPQSDADRQSDDPFKRDEMKRTIEMMPPSNDDLRWTTTAFTFMIAVLVFVFNVHWWSHASSCFKKSRACQRGFCRYGYPRGRSDRTVLTNKGIQLRRQPGCEYVNGFNEVIMATFKSNHDVQVLIGGEDVLDRIYYCCKYVTKPQNQVDSVTAVALSAFKRRQEKEDRQRGLQHAPIDLVVSRQRVASMAYSLTSRREVAGPLAALYILRKSCCYKSSPCENLPLLEVQKELFGFESHGCDLIEAENERRAANNDVYRSTSLLDDYRCRPQFLNSVSLYEYVMRYFRRKRTAFTGDDLLFSSHHPLYGTHCIGKHRNEVVPVVTGIRMPYVNDESPLDIVVKRCKAALVLFKPFRVLSDLVADFASDENWQRAFLEWEPLRSLFVQEIMDNMDDYYRAREKASVDLDENDTVDAHSSDDSELDGDFSDVDEYVDTCDFDDISISSSDFDEFHSPTLLEVNSIPETGDLNPILYPSSQQQCDIVGLLVEKNLLASSAQSTQLKNSNIRNSLQVGDSLAIGDESFSVHELRQWVKNTDTDDSLLVQCSVGSGRPTEVIELLSEALRSENMAWSPSNGETTPSVIEPYASLQSISRAKSLNERQHIAFCIAGKALLKKFYHQELAQQHLGDGNSSADYERSVERDQLLMFLGGAGGTGKTRVIGALSALCSSWHRENAMQKTALTGKAATIIGGRTLASFLLRIKYAIKRREFFDLELLAIDEVSMMTKPDWVNLDNLLRRYKKLRGITFGSIHIMLVGDFLQMPPVGSDPIYIDPSTKRNPSSMDITGFSLWRRFDKIVVLLESMRFHADPEWGEGCRNARLGNWTPEFLDLINNRLVANSTNLSRAEGNSVFVTPENATRLSINNAFVAEIASLLPSHTHPVRIVANFKNSLQGLSKNDIQFIMGLPDNRFGRLAPYLDLVAGMPVQVTQNVATTKGVANGTLGTLEHVHFPIGTGFRLTRDSTSKMVVQIPSRPPDYAVLRISRGEIAMPIRRGISPDLFPVFYNTEAYKESNVSLPLAPGGVPRKLAVKIQQLPFTCAAGSTVYKVQGETLNSMVVVDWKTKIAIVNKPQQIYLIVSRVTSRDAFLTMSPLTDELIAWAKPPAHALNEERRLVDLSEQTIAEWRLSNR